MDRYIHLVVIDPSATPEPGLTELPFLNVTVTSGCDHTPHLNLSPDYESCESLHLKVHA